MSIDKVYIKIRPLSNRHTHFRAATSLTQTTIPCIAGGPALPVLSEVEEPVLVAVLAATAKFIPSGRCARQLARHSLDEGGLPF
jgi:hypothetical protein